MCVELQGGVVATVRRIAKKWLDWANMSIWELPFSNVAFCIAACAGSTYCGTRDHACRDLLEGAELLAEFLTFETPEAPQHPQTKREEHQEDTIVSDDDVLLKFHKHPSSNWLRP
ncbi:hypothetical protein MPH_05484 [Macrophomina phaseolina MS6]|uniref:Uncharacterized protein n=1 Tax=Macrophomina phaseolina (strain MS6) TaxID=1126212 RepID=K2S419_MACPH|nr:hypothetical protein MPH_05484 [Macrophomina phaseolina MS6]